MIHADGILEVSRNLEYSLGWVFAMLLDLSERVPTFDFQMEHPVSNLIF